MIKVLLLLLISGFAHAQVKRTFAIGQLNPSPDTFEGVRFPRLNEVKYRGSAEVQTNRQTAVLAMLGADEPVESILFSALKLLLMKEQCSFCSQVTDLKTRNYFSVIEDKLEKNAGLPYNLSEARKIAFQIMEDDFKKKFENQSLFEQKINYTSSQYELFPQDLVFSTVYLEVANIYSRFITVFKESQPDFLDLNFWNKVRNGSWVFTQREWVDRGEFITPILIEAEKVSGFMEYLSQVPDYRVFRPLPNELDFAYMKTSLNGEDVVLVFDGYIGRNRRANAIKESRNKFFLAKSQFEPEADIPSGLQLLNDSPLLIGVIKLCPIKTKCTLQSDIFSNYKRSQRTMPDGILKLLGRTVNQKKIKVFYQNATLQINEDSSVPYKVVYPGQKALMDSLEKEASFNSLTRVSAPHSKTANKLHWKFDRLKLKNNEAVYLQIPDEFRNMKVTKFSLLQRQDEKDNSTPLRGNWDSSPAYTGVQFYALTELTADSWRFPVISQKFRTPKGSFFADIRNEEKMLPIQFWNWKSTQGHETDDIISQDISIGAVRLLGLGQDPATLYEFELEFTK